jgi:hypothetical protein
MGLGPISYSLSRSIPNLVRMAMERVWDGFLILCLILFHSPTLASEQVEKHTKTIQAQQYIN